MMLPPFEHAVICWNDFVSDVVWRRPLHVLLHHRQSRAIQIVADVADVVDVVA